MDVFMVQFLICNVFISIIIGILLAAKRLLKNSLTSRIQYNLWFLLLALLAVPFIPAQPIQFLRIFSWFGKFQNVSVSHPGTTAGETSAFHSPGSENWMNDFSMAISTKAPSKIGVILFILWIIGIMGMIALAIKSMRRFKTLKQSALPLQNPAIRRLFRDCLNEMNIAKNIPVYSTAFLKSPIIAGMFKPCIYLPIHLISDYKVNDIRYMLLHELQHYKYKDAFVNYIMNCVSILYWFNPIVWYALKEMRNDREIACDTSVLKMLKEDSYEDYGHTLINFAEKVSLTPFPFAAGIGGSVVQMKKRIINIANYHPVSFRKKIYSIFSYILVAVLLSGFVPILSIQAKENDRYYFNESGEDITYIDLKAYFGENSGSFVLYDDTENKWQIYNKQQAVTRITPVSTYKIYSALFGLESGIISPKQSLISWDGQRYMYDLWNTDQTLESAMQNSVTWYFQAIDQQADLPAIKKFIQKIGYGNQTVSEDISSYWIDSSLKISPVEQIEMLKKFYYNQFDFSPENISAVKDSILLYSTNQGTVYGKTGTGEIKGKNTLGWFIGYIEKDGHIYFFATNIQNEDHAMGAVAAELTFSILSELDIWNNY